MPKSFRGKPTPASRAEAGSQLLSVALAMVGFARQGIQEKDRSAVELSARGAGGLRFNPAMRGSPSYYRSLELDPARLLIESDLIGERLELGRVPSACIMQDQLPDAELRRSHRGNGSNSAALRLLPVHQGPEERLSSSVQLPEFAEARTTRTYVAAVHKVPRQEPPAQKTSPRRRPNIHDVRLPAVWSELGVASDMP